MQGSKKSTVYTYNCGDKANRTTSKKGYEDSKSFTCNYQKVGKYTVTVTAKNDAGKTVTATMRLLVEGEELGEGAGGGGVIR